MPGPPKFGSTLYALELLGPLRITECDNEIDTLIFFEIKMSFNDMTKTVTPFRLAVCTIIKELVNLSNQGRLSSFEQLLKLTLREGLINATDFVPI